MSRRTAPHCLTDRMVWLLSLVVTLCALPALVVLAGLETHYQTPDS